MSAHNSFTVSKSTRPSSKSRKRKNYVEESAFQNVDLEMLRFKLFFNDPLHEKKFRWNFYYKSRTVVRLCISGIIIMVLLSFLFDLEPFASIDSVSLFSVSFVSVCVHQLHPFFFRQLVFKKL